MKKIYILTAVFALLTLSLNAQTQTADHSNYQLHNVNVKGMPSLNSSTSSTSSTDSRTSFKNLLRGTKGMSSIMPQLYNGTGVQGKLRAPLKINSDEVTVGPFTGDNFDANAGLGFGAAYSQPQFILVNTVLDRSEFADHIGDEIVGFRFALAGDVTSRVKVSQFTAWPIDMNSGAFDQDHLYSWPLTDFINVEVPTYNQYEKVTSTSGLESGAEYLIVCENNNVAFDGSRTSLDVSGNTISVTPSNGIIASTATTDAATFTITANGSSYSIRSKSGYYIGRTTNSNGMNTNQNTAYTNNITFNNGNATIAGQYRYLRYLATQGNLRFRYYATNSGAQNIQLYKKVTVSGTAPDYVELAAGQWHEFYLDNPVTFNVGSDVTNLFMGYEYVQYPTGTTGENLFPIAINPQSTTHDHYAYLTTESETSGGDITISIENCFQTSFYYIIVVDNTTGNYLTYWTSDGTTYTANGNVCYELPAGWSLDGAGYFYQETNSGYNFGYLSINGPASIVISSAAFGNKSDVSVVIAAVGWDDGYTVSVNNVSKTIEALTIADYEWNPVTFSGTTTSTNTGWNYFDFSQYGDLAVQLIFKKKDPELTAPTDGSTVDVGTHQGAGVSTTIPVSGHNLTGDLTVSVSGTGFSVSPTTISAADANAGTSVTVTYTGTDPNATGTLTITSSNGEVETVNVNLTASYVAPVPELTAPTDGATVNVGTNTGSGVSTTITVSGENLTSDLTISVEGTGFSVEPTTISAADANAGTTITVTYNGYSAAGTGTLTITSSNGEVEPVTVNLTGNFVPQPIEPVTGLLRLHLLLVDQLKANIPDDNSHADAYRYVLKYEPAGEEPKESSPVKVDIHKTEAEVKGYYTKAEIDGDTDGTLEMNVLTADVEFNLTDDDNTIDFYNLQGKANEYPALGDNYLTKLQQTTGFVYYEMLEGPNKGDDYPAGLHHYYDDSTPILTGTYTNGFMSYAPSLSTFGVERRYYEDDGLDNTYGAPIWRTRVGDVQIQGNPAMQKQVINAGTPQEAPNPYTSWTADGKNYSLFFLGVNAQGTLPNTQGTYGTNIKYEPYMFRVFVSSPSGKLRKYVKKVGQGGGYYLEDGGAIAANEKYCVGSFYEDNGWHAADLFFSRSISNTNSLSFRAGGDDEFDPDAWDGIMKFAAEDGISANDIKVYVRFYYMVDGWDTRDGEARPGNGAEGSGDPDDPTTYIYEYTTNAEVVGVTFYNAQGMKSDKPFDGVNIVVTRYSDGSISTTKVMR